MGFLIKSLICTTALAFLASHFGVSNLWIVVVGTCTCALPIFVSQFYLSTIAQIRSLHAFERHGWIYQLLSRRWLKLIFWILWALVTSFVMLIQFHTYSTQEWILFFLVSPVFWIVYRTARSFISKELKAYLVTYWSLLWARRITPLIMFLLSLVLTPLMQGLPGYESWSQAIEAQMEKVEDMIGSQLVFEASHWLAYYEGAKAYMFGRLWSQDLSWWICSLLVASVLWIVYFSACAMLSCLLIPRLEYRRIFVPLTDEVVPPAPTKGRIAAISAVATIVVFFLYLPLIVGLENWIRQNPQIRQQRETSQARLNLYVEQIEREYYRVGTIDSLVQLRKELLLENQIIKEKISAGIDRAYDVMEARVDRYLDWYYSLPAEYTRIAKMLVGEVEQYMLEKFTEHVLSGDQLKSIQDTIAEAMERYDRLAEKYRTREQAILDDNRLALPSGPFKIVRTLSLDQIPLPTVGPEAIDVKTRLGFAGAAGAGTGLITGILIKKTLGKLAAKTSFTVAAKSLVKIAGSKVAGAAAGTAAGAAIGAAVGSVVPGVGTAVGAAIGGAIGGAAVGVGVDKLMLMLEESISREKFKAEIVEALRESRRELKASLGLNEEEGR